MRLLTLALALLVSGCATRPMSQHADTKVGYRIESPGSLDPFSPHFGEPVVYATGKGQLSGPPLLSERDCPQGTRFDTIVSWGAHDGELGYAASAELAFEMKAGIYLIRAQRREDEVVFTVFSTAENRDVVKVIAEIAVSKVTRIGPNEVRIEPVKKERPNKAPEPTPGTVTSRADARLAPVPVVAHL